LVLGVGCAGYALVAMAASGDATAREMLILGFGAFYVACWFADRGRVAAPA
jgi:hypothetical protein